MSEDLVQTPYGTLSRSALEALQDDYGASELLRMVEEFDQSAQAFQDEGGLRSQLLTLHGMLHAVIDNAQVTVAADQSLPYLASDVMDEIQDIRDMFERWTGMLSRIRDLSSPEPLDRDLP